MIVMPVFGFGPVLALIWLYIAQYADIHFLIPDCAFVQQWKSSDLSRNYWCHNRVHVYS